MKKIPKIIFTLPLAVLALNTVQATKFTPFEMDITNRSTPQDMRVVFNLIPAHAGDRTHADMVRRVGGTLDGGAAATLPGAVTTLRSNITDTPGAHAAADLATLRAAVTGTAGANALAEVNTVKASIGTAAQFDAAHADATAVRPATSGPGVAGQFTDGTIGTTAIGVSGTVGNPDALNEETRNLLRLAFRRFTVGINADGSAADDQGYLNDGNDSAAGLARVAGVLNGVDENTVSLSDIIRAIYAISIHGKQEDVKLDKEDSKSDKFDKFDKKSK